VPFAKANSWPMLAIRSFPYQHASRAEENQLSAAVGGEATCNNKMNENSSTGGGVTVKSTSASASTSSRGFTRLPELTAMQFNEIASLISGNIGSLPIPYPTDLSYRYRRRPDEVPENELWRCKFERCIKHYKRTSSRSINKHTASHEHQQQE